MSPAASPGGNQGVITKGRQKDAQSTQLSSWRCESPSLPQSTMVVAIRKLTRPLFTTQHHKSSFSFSHLLHHFPKKWSWLFFFFSLNDNLFLAYSVYLPTEQLGHYLWRTPHSFPKEVIPVTHFQVFWVRHKRKEKSFPEKSKSNRQKFSQSASNPFPRQGVFPPINERVGEWTISLGSSSPDIL